MKMFYLNVKNRMYETVDIEPKLDEYYRLIDCTCIDIVNVQLCGHWYWCICDDEALLKDGNYPSILIDNHNFIYGNILICAEDEHAPTTERGLEYLELRAIYASVYQAFGVDSEFHPVLLGDHYELEDIE